MKYTVNLRIETHSYTVLEPYTVSAGNPKSAGAIASARAMDIHGRKNITEISVISAEEAKRYATA